MNRFTTNAAFPTGAIAQSFGLSYEIVHKRIKRGYSWKDALMLPHAAISGKYSPTGRRPSKFSYHAIAKDFGIPTGTLISRIKQGWGWHEALTKTSRPKEDVNDAIRNTSSS